MSLLVDLVYFFYGKKGLRSKIRINIYVHHIKMNAKNVMAIFYWENVFFNNNVHAWCGG